MFVNGDIIEYDVGTSDEKHFIVKDENGKTLGFRGKCEVILADFVSGVELIAMLERLKSGRCTNIWTSFINF